MSATGEAFFDFSAGRTNTTPSDAPTWDRWLSSANTEQALHSNSTASLFGAGNALFGDITNSYHNSGNIMGKRERAATPTSPETQSLHSKFPIMDESPGADIAMRLAAMVVTPDAKGNSPVKQTASTAPPPTYTPSSTGSTPTKDGTGSGSGASNSSMSIRIGSECARNMPIGENVFHKHVIVEFKNHRKLQFKCDPTLPVGQNSFVIVRLEQNVGWAGNELPLDVGLCTAVYGVADRHHIPKSLGHDAGTVLRIANEEDCSIIDNVLPQVEAEALKQCHQLIHFLHLPFNVLDAEYSFDQRIVRFLYTLSPQASTSNAPNVSRLQRELSVRLKCKVVLEQQKTIDQQISHPRL